MSNLSRNLRAAGAALAICFLAGAAWAQPYGKGGNFVQLPNKPPRQSSSIQKVEAPKPEPKAATTGAATPVNDTFAPQAEAPVTAER